MRGVDEMHAPHLSLSLSLSVFTTKKLQHMYAVRDHNLFFPVRCVINDRTINHLRLLAM